MITLITGAPGAGKTNALVSLLAELAEGRALYVSGIPDLSVPHVVLDDPTKWHEVVEDGAAVVIDEVQRVWRPNRSKIPDDIAALETHRHRGIDFFIVTQSPGLVHANVRALIGRHVHLRDTGITGRWWYEWPECADNVTSAWKQAPLKKPYRLDKKAQSLYTSASKHVKPIRSLPASVVFLVVVLLALAGMGWKVYDLMRPKLDLAANMGKPPASAASAPRSAASAAGADLSAEPARLTASEPAPVEPSASAPRLAGCIRMSARCECLDDRGYVLTVPLDVCHLNAARTGDRMPYDHRPPSGLAELLQRTPDASEPPSASLHTAALSPRSAAR